MKNFIDAIKQNLIENRIWDENRTLTSNFLMKVERKTQNVTALPESYSKFYYQFGQERT